jgi:hypothetical protein
MTWYYKEEQDERSKMDLKIQGWKSSKRRQVRQSVHWAVKDMGSLVLFLLEIMEPRAKLSFAISQLPFSICS